MYQQLVDLLHGRRQKDGPSALEYGLLVALIAAVVMVAVIALGGFVSGAFTDTTSDGICGGDAFTASCPD